jgi:S1-C subfamily serine protease
VRGRSGRIRGVLAALLCGALLVAGCGGGDDGGDGDGTSAEANQTAPERPPRVIVEAAGPDFNAAEIYRRAAPGVVTISSIFRDGGLLDQGTSGQGSGFVLNRRGEIVTNAHVVTQGQGASVDRADQVFVEFRDRNEVAAEVVGFDPFVDVALLRIDPEGLRLVPLALGNDRALRVGQPVAAIGSPFGETQSQSLTTGVVSALHRSVESLTAFQVSEAIQTDAAINPGNSGGPLLDANGRVIGINQQIRTRSGANAGVGFAVPVTAITRSVAQLREDGEAEYAFIGVSTLEVYPQLAERLGLPEDHGALISDVVSDGPADDAGLRAGDRRIRFQASRVEVGGDVILAINGREVVDSEDLANHISAHRPGDEVTVEILRDGDRREVEVTLGTRPFTVPD